MTAVKIKQQNEEVSYSMYILHAPKHKNTRKLELHAPYRRRLVGLNLRHTAPLIRRGNIPVPTLVCTQTKDH